MIFDFFKKAEGRWDVLCFVALGAGGCPAKGYAKEVGSR